MLHVRWDHTATKLLDGRVLFAGGSPESAATAEIYQPDSNRFVEAAPLLHPRYQHAAVLLPDGRVLVSGGSGAASSCEVHDPTADSWAEAPSHAGDGFVGHDLAITPGGTVIAIDGTETEVLEMGAVSWIPAPPMPTRRNFFMSAALPDGRVAVIGGFRSGVPSFAVVELFDPATMSWSPGAPMSAARYDAAVAVLDDGRVMIAGGRGDTWEYVGTAEVYFPERDQWTPPTSAVARWDAVAAVLSDEAVLVGGGARNREALHDVELFNQGAADLGPPLTAARVHHSAIALDDGWALVAAGGVEGSDGGDEDLNTEILERVVRR